MRTIGQAGYRIVRDGVADAKLELLRDEANRLAEESGNACVRRVCEKSDELNQFAESDVLMALLPDGMMLVRSLLFDKTPEENWPVAWHQDLTICVKRKVEIEGYGPWSVKDGSVHVQPPSGVLASMVTLRVHLDDASASNGALKVIPNSPMLGKIEPSALKRHVIDEVVCECRAGDVLMMSPLTLHASSRSIEPNRRRVLHFEYAPANCLHEELEWA